MSLPKAYLATKLAEPLPTTDGGLLRTIGDAIAYMIALRNSCQCPSLCGPLLINAELGESRGLFVWRYQK